MYCVALLAAIALFCPFSSLSFLLVLRAVGIFWKKKNNIWIANINDGGEIDLHLFSCNTIPLDLTFPLFSLTAVRFGRVPKKEKARIIEQMQKVNSQSQSTALSTILQNEQDVVHAVINAHHMTCDLSLSRVSQMRDHALQLSNYINCPANMVSVFKVRHLYYFVLSVF